MTRKPRSPLEWTLITLVLLAAALLRFHDLGNIPKGLEHDEVATWHMVNDVLEGRHPIYFEEGYGHEPMFNYLTAIPLSLFGHNWLGERFWAPWFGMFAVAATYALMRHLFNPLVGLSASGFQATVLWALFFNRLGLRLNQLPFLLCVTAYCFWRGVESTSPKLQFSSPRGSQDPDRSADSRAWPSADSPTLRFAVCGSRLGWFIAAGVLMGLCFYTYMSSRVVPLIFGGFTVYLIAHSAWLGDSTSLLRVGWRRVFAEWWPVLVCFIAAALVMAPLALYLLDRPSTTTVPQREEQVDRPLRELAKGNPRLVLENAWGLLKMWNVDGERYWQLNYSHRPVFVEPISGLLFWAGTLIVLWQWKDPRKALLAIWIGLGTVPSLITSEAPSWPRTMLASPAALALPGIAVSTAIARLRNSRIRHFRDLHVCTFSGHVLIFLLNLSLLVTFALTYRDFLIVWPGHPRVRYAFQSSMTEALRYLDATADPTPVAMAGLSPHDMDRWTQKVTLQRRDLSIRWIDTRSALALPAGDAARLIVLDITPQDPALSQWAGLASEAVLARGEIVPRSGTEHDADAPVHYDPAYTVYRLDGAILRQRIQTAHSAAYTGSDPFEPVPLDAPPQFGSLVRLAGYEWLTAPQPGAPARLLTFWQALDTGPSSMVYSEPALRIFLHLLDREQAVVASTDVLGVSPDTWLAGDLIVQLHTFASPDEPGNYAVEIGWYVPPDGPRLPVDGVDAPGQRVLLDRVELGR